MNSNRDFGPLLDRIAQNSDQRAYKELFEAFYDSLYQFALSYVKSGDLADEVVSDVFIKIWKKREGLLRIRNLRLYLFTSTRNTALNYLKRKDPESLAPENYRVQLQSVYFDPERLMLTAEMVNLVQQAIRQLPPRCQLIFKLVKEEGLKYREVADLLEISTKTVEAQMTIALSRIGSVVKFDIHSSISSGR